MYEKKSMVIYSNGRSYSVVIDDFEYASLIGKYHNAVKMFLQTRWKSYLEPFIGKRIRDANGRWHPLETDPIQIYEIRERMANEEFFQIYD